VKIVERFFTSDEQAYILSAQQEDVLNKRFFEVWTKKESRIKCEGKDLLEALTSFSVLDPPLKQSKFVYQHICNNGEIIGHVCSSKTEPPSVRVMDHSMLLQQVKLLE
jgi:phosphopantetheinyl transferase